MGGQKESWARCVLLKNCLLASVFLFPTHTGIHAVAAAARRVANHFARVARCCSWAAAHMQRGCGAVYSMRSLAHLMDFPFGKLSKVPHKFGPQCSGILSIRPIATVSRLSKTLSL